MISSLKVSETIRCLDKDRLKQCRKFLSSPYFNSSKELVKLFDLIVKNEERASEMTKKQAWKKLRGKAPYEDVRFRKFCSDLLKLITRFLSHEYLERNEFYQLYFLLHELQRTNAKKLVPGVYKKLESTLESSEEGYVQQQLQTYQYEQLKYLVEEYDLKRSKDTNIEQVHAHLDQFYFSEKMYQTNRALTQQRLVNAEYEIHYIDEALHVLQTPPLSELPDLQINYLIYHTIKDGGNDDAYFALKDFLLRKGDTFSQKEVMVYYQSAMNYCARRINKGESAFVEELFELFLQILDKNLAIQDGQFNPWLFRNITIIGIRLKKYDWVENFVKEYEHSLSEEYRDNLVAYNLAVVYYHQKNYKEIISQIRNIEYQDLTYNIDSKAMLLVAFFEEGEYDVLQSHIDAFLAYLNRHKDIAVSRHKPRQLLARFAKRLLRVKPWDQKALTKLRQDMEANPIPETPWLLEKLDEIEGKPKKATA